MDCRTVDWKETVLLRASWVVHDCVIMLRKIQRVSNCRVGGSHQASAVELVDVAGLFGSFFSLVWVVSVSSGCDVVFQGFIWSFQIFHSLWAVRFGC